MDEIDELRQVFDRHITLKLWTVIYARCNFMNFYAEMLSRFQLQIEKPWQELGFGPRSFSISPVWLDMIRYNQIWCTNVNLFVPNAPFLHPLKTWESPTIFCYFEGVEKECIDNKWVNRTQSPEILRNKKTWRLKLCEKCPNSELFWSVFSCIRILYLSVFSPNAGKYGPE